MNIDERLEELVAAADGTPWTFEREGDEDASSCIIFARNTLLERGMGRELPPQPIGNMGFTTNARMTIAAPALAQALLRARQRRYADARVRDALNELLPLIDTPRGGFKHEDDYVVWQRSINHWQQEGRLAIEAVPDSDLEDTELEEAMK